MILASVNVYQCDNCPKTIAVKSDAEFEAFEATWFVGLLHDFCPACRYTVAVQARILEDEQTTLRLARMNADEEKKTEYAN